MKLKRILALLLLLLLPSPALAQQTYTGAGEALIVATGNDSTAATAAWTSATALDTTLSITTTNRGQAFIELTVTGTITGGSINLEVTSSGSNWAPASMGSPTAGYGIIFPLAPYSGVTRIISGSVAGSSSFRVRLNPVITGTGTANLRILAASFPVQEFVSQGNPNAGGSAVAWYVSTKSALTANAPTAASVGVASAQALAANTNRKSLIAVNTSANTISCSVAQTAVLNSGITLFPNGVWNMNEYSFATGAINCIASAAASNLSLQEFQ